MIITTSKPTLPGCPFGFIEGPFPWSVGRQAIAKYFISYGGIGIPAGTCLTVLEKTKRYVRFELEFPESPRTH